jgi:hypothetical protein
MRVSSQEARNGLRSRKELSSGQCTKPFLHPIARFAAHLIRKIPPMEFQNLHFNATLSGGW